jgi:hypothetical protein
MKLLMTLAFALTIGAAFADDCACCKPAFDAKAFNGKDKEFLAQANRMAMGEGEKKMACCAAPEKKVKAKKSTKVKRAKAHKAVKARAVAR